MLTFSVFPDGITNTTNPTSSTIKRTHEVLIGTSAKQLTDWVRKFKADGDATSQSNAKCKLPYACFSGEFSKRAVAGIVSYNGMVIADIDHCQDAPEIRDIIAEDKHCALAFVSPSGDGVKALFLTDCKDSRSHKAAFASVAKHVKETHGLDLDPSGSDVSRACFLGHDPDARHNPLAVALPVDLTLAPMEIARQQSAPSGINVGKWNREKIGKNRHDYLFAYCRHLAMAGAGVDEIIAAATKMQEQRFELKNGNPYADQREIVRQAEGAVLMFGGEADPVADKLAVMKTLEAWDAESAATGQEIEPAPLLTQEQELIADSLKSQIPIELMTPGGIIQDIMGFIEDHEIRNQPILRLGAALSCVGSLMGRRYRSITNGRTNLFCLGIAGSGKGKDAAREALKLIFTTVWSQDPGNFQSMTERIQAEDVASGAGLMSLMRTNQTRLLLWDEFGKVLASVLGQRCDPHRALICKELLRIYSSAGSIMTGTAKADQNLCPLLPIDQPHLTIWGTSTGSTIWDVIGPQSFDDGLLPRFLVFVGDDSAPRKTKNFHARCPDDLAEKIRTAVSFGADSSQNFQNVPIEIPRTEDAKRLFAEFGLWCDSVEDKAKKGGDKTASIWTRAEQKADQLSLCIAWSNNPEQPVVGLQEAKYAIDLVKWCTSVFLEHVEAHMSTTPFQKDKNNVLKAIKNAGPAGLLDKDIARLLGDQKNLYRKEIIDALIAEARIVTDTRKTPGQRGRPANVAIYAEYRQDLVAIASGHWHGHEPEPDPDDDQEVKNEE